MFVIKDYVAENQYHYGEIYDLSWPAVMGYERHGVPNGGMLVSTLSIKVGTINLT